MHKPGASRADWTGARSDPAGATTRAICCLLHATGTLSFGICSRRRRRAACPTGATLSASTRPSRAPTCTPQTGKLNTALRQPSSASCFGLAMFPCGLTPHLRARLQPTPGRHARVPGRARPGRPARPDQGQVGAQSKGRRRRHGRRRRRHGGQDQNEVSIPSEPPLGPALPLAPTRSRPRVT